MDAPKLGQFIEGDEHRDAIHIAVCPVIALERLWPGQNVGLAKGSQHEVVAAEAPRLYSALGGRLIKTDGTPEARSDVVGIGIVDPFLRDTVEPGKKFWMFLYPGTITSLRHEWTHPAFADVGPSADDREEAERWLRDFASRNEIGFFTLIEGARSGDGACFGDDDGPRNVDDEFWRQMERFTGQTFSVAHRDATYFRCAC